MTRLLVTVVVGSFTQDHFLIKTNNESIELQLDPDKSPAVAVDELVKLVLNRGALKSDSPVKMITSVSHCVVP